MRRRYVAAIITTLGLLTPRTATSQGPYVWVGGAASVPAGDSKDVLKTGWMVTVGGGIPIRGSRSLSVQLDGLYGSSDFKATDASTKLYAGFVNVLCELMPLAKIHPYVYAGAGMLGSKPEGGESEAESAFQAGVGLSRSLAPNLSLWVDVRYMSGGSGTSKITLTPVSIGLSRTLGS